MPARACRGVEDVYAVLILALLRETFEARAGPVPLQQLKAQLLENDIRFGRVDGVWIHKPGSPSFGQVI